MRDTLTRVAAALQQWPTRSQQQARRNAMVAATELAARRIAREDVEEFLALRFGELDPDAVSRAIVVDAPALRVAGEH